MTALAFDIGPSRPPGMPADEWHARVSLAACYRLFDFLGWTEGIYNHISVRVSDPDGTPALLINPYGLHYAEVTAHNLVRIDFDGTVLGESRYPINAAGAVIHCAVHGARADAHCVMHTHTTSVMAVACKEGGLRSDNFYSALLFGKVAYHDFEGVTTQADEGARLVADLGSRPIMLLRNHGVLVCGSTLPDAFATLWQVQRACDVQLASDSMSGPNRAVPAEVLHRIDHQVQPMRPSGTGPGELLFAGLLRRARITLDDLVDVTT